MPQLPEVETVRRGLEESLPGRRFAQVVQRRADLRFPLPKGFAGKLTGRRVDSVGRRGKYLLWRLDNGLVVIAHLGMSGRLTVRPPGTPGAAETPGLARHDHLVFHMDDGGVVLFNDVRRFGLMDLVGAEGLEAHPLLAAMGPEPLGNEFNASVLGAALKGRRVSIKAALLDQKVVAGLGNIYVSEALFRAGISPRRLAAHVPGARAARLVPAIRDVLEEAIKAGGSTLRDYVQASGELGYFQHKFAVYGREGEPCPGCDCAGAIRRIVQSGRSTYYCSKRQR